MSGTLNIDNNLFELFPMAFSRVQHKLENHTKNKGNVMLNMNNINNTSNQLSIKKRIDYGCLSSFGELDLRLKRSRKWLTINHLKTCQNIHHIFTLINEKSIT